MSGKACFIPVAALALIAAAPAPSAALASNAGESGSVTASAPGAKADKGERKICRTFEATGSRTRGEKLCLTKAKWKEFERSQRN
jgi:hypothetical protein